LSTDLSERSDVVPRIDRRGGKELLDILYRELLSAGDIATQGRFCDLAFALPKFDHLLLDGVFDDQSVDQDGFVLPDAVGAIGGLVFDGGIPPRIVVDDGIRLGEGETAA